MSTQSKILRLMKNIKPTRMWIDGECFDIPKHEEVLSKIFESHMIEEYKVKYNIKYIDDLYHTSFRLPGTYYEKLQKIPNTTTKNLEDDNRVTIKIPHHESNEAIIISSKDIQNLIGARTELHMVCSAIREKQYALQFISIPLKNDGIKTKFEYFKKDILHNQEIKGIHESIFQKSERLHLTVGVFSLLDDIEKTEAIKTLDECKEKVINPIISKSGPLKVTICGLECMNNDYNKVKILYANAKACEGEEEDLLQLLVNSISKFFYGKGLIRQYQENIKIHVTLMNTKYRKVEGGKRKWKDKKLVFDASTIMEKYKDFHFGECDLNEIHLSWISKIDQNGFYKPLSIITV